MIQRKAMPIIAIWMLLLTQEHAVADPLVRIRLDTADLIGNPITQITAGESFQLRAFVLDLRTTGNTGVFSAFTDVTFDPTLATVSGPIVHALDYMGFTLGDAMTPGLLNEVGGLMNSITPPGPSERLLFSVPFQAIAPGMVNFAADKADHFQSEMILYDLIPVVPAEQVVYGSTNLTIVPEPATLLHGAVATAILLVVRLVVVRPRPQQT